jgi:VCBS repeat-containing protein
MPTFRVFVSGECLAPYLVDAPSEAAAVILAQRAMSSGEFNPSEEGEWSYTIDHVDAATT